MSAPLKYLSDKFLISSGIPVKLIELTADLALDLRASTFHPPTLDFLDKLGVTQSLVDQGLICQHWQFRDRNQGTDATFDLSLLEGETSFPFRLQCEQWKLTKALRDFIENHPDGELITETKAETVGQDDDKVWVKPCNQDTRAQSMWGLGRTLVDNMVTGVSEGFSRKLEIVGVGYRAAVDGNVLNLQLGYSHEVKVMIPDGIKVVCAKPTEIEISGADKQQVGQIAADIRGLRKPEPYKGKGIKYEGEYIFRKEGKKK